MTSTRATKQALIKQLTRYKDSTGCTYQDIATPKEELPPSNLGVRK
ncbi:TPA: hypothetical protein U2B49_001689 [Streptococcus suis]|nr:hypothetical protein [Streptococcus suis]HEM6008921.1 hypothetical protein [Streptococcus suis]HEM6014637.1 hypothetical protein [Streptococcus suis]HEM6028727.1 hypothetical protein [Streptococcus suis]HEM6030647.1 hypothetical protein [Streptococcus suis]